MRLLPALRNGLMAAIAVALLSGAAARASLAAEEAKTAGSTLDNLQAAFNGESNAHARYLAFAVKADEEGYAGVASLFRAAARAEEIHAASHAVVIRKLGGTPRADLKAPEVGPTAANLDTAIKGETYERDTMYPEFLKQAKAEGNKEAIRSFNYAKTAEAEHARMYKEALDGLDSWKTVRDFYVCTVCGYTTTNLDFEKCLSCFNPKEKYVKVD